MKKNSGVSMISLVITIIVIIILAAVAFGSSTDTIENANFSNFTNNVAEVQGLLDQQAVTLKGNEGKEGVSRTDAQVYNFLAKGATLEEDNEKYWLPRATATTIGCTQLNSGDMPTVIDYELPAIKVATDGANSVLCSYFVTNTGKVFVWPPYIYENELYVNGDTKLIDPVSKNPYTDQSGDLVYADGFSFEVAGATIKVDTDATAVRTTGNTMAAADIFYNNNNVSPEGREIGTLYTEVIGAD